MRDARLRYEEAGVDALFNWDHFFPLFGEPDGPHFGCWTMLGAMAADPQPARPPEPGTRRLGADHDRRARPQGDAASDGRARRDLARVRLAGGVAASNAILDAWCEILGRDPGESERSVTVQPASTDRIDDFAQAGVSLLVAGLDGPAFDLALVEKLIAYRDARQEESPMSERPAVAPMR